MNLTTRSADLRSVVAESLAEVIDLDPTQAEAIVDTALRRAERLGIVTGQIAAPAEASAQEALTRAGFDYDDIEAIVQTLSDAQLHPDLLRREAQRLREAVDYAGERFDELNLAVDAMRMHAARTDAPERWAPERPW